MRARWLKPEFFTDRKIAKLGMAAALVFEALWCVADDGGVAECDPVLLKGQMFMRWDDVTVQIIESAIERLAAAGLLEHYGSGDGEYALIRSWRKNQPVHNPSPFRHPRPPQVVTDANGKSLPQESGSAAGALRPDSHPIHPDTQTPRHPDTQTPKYPDTSTPKASARARRNGDAPVSREFEEIWAAYPKRSGGDSRADALLAFLARVRAGEDPIVMLAGVRRYAAYCVATEKIGTEYVKQARTFLGRSRHYIEEWDLPTRPATSPRRGAPREYDYSKPTDNPKDVKWQK